MALILTLASVTTACGDPAPKNNTPDAGPGPDVIEQDGFNDHTVGALESKDDFLAISKESTSLGVAKFIVTGFQDPSLRELRFMDSNFYTLHDEWHWFRLLNGETIPGVDINPVFGFEFETIAEVYQWALSLGDSALPLDLRWTRNRERLYSQAFYDLVLGDDRFLGAGALLLIPARQEPEPTPERWAFELEFSDEVTHPELVLYFEELEASLPAEIGQQVLWVIRSPAQEALAVTMETQRLPYHDRILRYSELATPGEVEVYNEGITAGRVFVARTGGDKALTDSRAHHLLMTDVVPDYLPQGNALVTSVPQTPLAHVNVLARNRGIPNAYVGGLMDDAAIRQLERVSSYAVIRTKLPDTFQIEPITSEQYRTWDRLRARPPAAVPQVDIETLPHIQNLAELDIADEAVLRLTIGGKAAGFLALAAPGTVTMPDKPLALTIRPYVEHIAPIRPIIEAMLSHSDFSNDSRVRFMVLEGLEDYDGQYPSDKDQSYRDQFVAALTPDSALDTILKAGGLKALIRAQDMNPDTLGAIRAVIDPHYSHYSLQQGLRFRSSSTAEDIEGFNGAGLYDSNTGFISPSRQSDPKDHKKSLEWAIKKTWASYWGFEAFEERKLEKIDHLSGNMAVLIHARFDDPMEASNGVFTLTLMPPGSPDRAVMELNAQHLDESVTNPEPGSGALPEVDRVRLSADSDQPIIERVSASNRVQDGQHVLTDADLLQIFSQALDVTTAWQTRANAPLPANQQDRVLTLDFEFRQMQEGWPALGDSDEPFPKRIVIKQARSLERGLRQIPTNLLEAPIARDVLRRASRVEARACESQDLLLTVLEVFTDPIITPDLGHDVRPFTASIQIDVLADIEALGLSAGDRILVDHTGLLRAEHPDMVDESTWSLDAAPDPALTQAFTQLKVQADGAWQLENAQSTHQGTFDACDIQLLHASPEDYLRSFLPPLP